MVNSCVFCKIVAGEIPSAKIYEDKRFIAIMDLFPSIEGKFLVVPKEHVTSKFTAVPDHVLTEAMITTKKVAQHVDSVLGTRSCIAVEGFQIPHLHIQVYPLPHGKYLKHAFGSEPKQANLEELKKLAERLKM